MSHDAIVRQHRVGEFNELTYFSRVLEKRKRGKDKIYRKHFVKIKNLI